MGWFKGSSNQEQTEMPRDGQCHHRHHGPPGPQWFNSPRHYCPESTHHHGPPNPGFGQPESRNRCPRSGHKPPFFAHDSRRFPEDRPPFFGQKNDGDIAPQGPHGGHPFFGHNHHRHWHGPRHEGFDDQNRNVKFHGCPFSRRRNCDYEYKPVFDRRQWE